MDRTVIGDLSFVVFDVGTDNVESLDPSGDHWVASGSLGQGDPERAVTILYEKILNSEVRDVNHRNTNSLQYALGLDDSYQGLNQNPRAPDWVISHIQDRVEQHVSIGSSMSALDVVDIDGIPDLVVYKADSRELNFVEVKNPPESLSDDQVNWIRDFDFLPIKIACVFEDSEKRDRFVQNNSVDDLLEKSEGEDPVEQRPELSSEEIAARLDSMSEGDLVLFNDRKEPMPVTGLDVTKSGAGDDVTGVEVTTSQGSSCVLSAVLNRHAAA